jgi:hypothetical protein
MRIGLKEGQGFLAGYRPSFLFLPLILRTLESRLAKKKSLSPGTDPRIAPSLLCPQDTRDCQGSENDGFDNFSGIIRIVKILFTPHGKEARMQIHHRPARL